MSSESSTFNSSSNNDSNIINSPNSNKRAIQQTLLDLIRTLTKECKHIFHLTEKEDSEISNAYNRALRTSLTVIEIVQFMPSDYQNILVESARLINSTVVELVKASKVFTHFIFYYYDIIMHINFFKFIFISLFVLIIIIIQYNIVLIIVI